MPCDPIEFLNLAKQLSNPSGSEIEWRSGISRAYYAAFHWADGFQSHCPEIHLDSIRGGMHERLIQRYLKHSDSNKAKQIGYILRDMRNKRESADYRLADSFKSNDCVQQILTAEKIKALLDDFVGTSAS